MGLCYCLNNSDVVFVDLRCHIREFYLGYCPSNLVSSLKASDATFVILFYYLGNLDATIMGLWCHVCGLCLCYRLGNSDTVISCCICFCTRVLEH